MKHKSAFLAIAVHNNFAGNGVRFFVPDGFPRRLACVRHPGGKLVDPCAHHAVHGNIPHTREIPIIKRGRLRVDFRDAIENC